MAEDKLVPIEEVARRFGVRASALRYYERRGLLQPSARRAGRRWYGPAGLRRLAIIGFWQRSGQLSLEDIAAIRSPARGITLSTAAPTSRRPSVRVRRSVVYTKREHTGDPRLRPWA